MSACMCMGVGADKGVCTLTLGVCKEAIINWLWDWPGNETTLA